MFRIHRIVDDILPGDLRLIDQVQEILRDQFPLLGEEKIARIPEQLRDPMKYRFRTILLVAEGERGRVKGFALLQHAPDLRFCYLDYISAARHRMGGGIGSALYERVREVSISLGAVGLFFECLPDDPNLCKDPVQLRDNRSRLRFYESYGTRPIIHTSYEAPVSPGSDCPPYLMYDHLGTHASLRRSKAKQIVRAILERQYGDLCTPEYVQMVVSSFRDDPVRLRPYRYLKGPERKNHEPSPPGNGRILLTVNDRHHIHHVHERGYVESPVRIDAIQQKIEPTGLFESIPIRHYSERHIKAVHDSRYVEYFKKVCSTMEPGRSLYPYVFPIRNGARPPKELPVRAGYYCIDTFTPLNQNAYLAAKRAVDSALTIAERMLDGARLGYALVRPPGHHAEHRAFGGFCYFNSAAIAAHYLSGHGKVAVLDIDYHHGNGTQNIFYDRSDVLTLSIHGHPRFAYPYFSGFEEERGEGEGKGFNRNFPLQEAVDGEIYRRVLERALRRITRFGPRFLIIALGLDTANGDPTGTWKLIQKDFRLNGNRIGALGLPTMVVQEGGYKIRSLGSNARHFFLGLWEGASLPAPSPKLR
jgi:acetoin utilization deacetylase AcuC-like enzyme/GNAT superfamily N-acetyltransferase